jgi:hypothetical protein
MRHLLLKNNRASCLSEKQHLYSSCQMFGDMHIDFEILFVLSFQHIWNQRMSATNIVFSFG